MSINSLLETATEVYEEVYGEGGFDQTIGSMQDAILLFNSELGDIMRDLKLKDINKNRPLDSMGILSEDHGLNPLNESRTFISALYIMVTIKNLAGLKTESLLIENDEKVLDSHIINLDDKELTLQLQLDSHGFLDSFQEDSFDEYRFSYNSLIHKFYYLLKRFGYEEKLLILYTAFISQIEPFYNNS